MLRVLADDPAAAIDIPAWCRMRGQELLPTDDPATFDVRRTDLTHGPRPSGSQERM